MENEIELADALEGLVEGLDEHLDEVEDSQLTLSRVHTEYKIQGSVVPINESAVLARQEITKGAGGVRKKVIGEITFHPLGNCKRRRLVWRPTGRSHEGAFVAPLQTKRQTQQLK